MADVNWNLLQLHPCSVQIIQAIFVKTQHHVFLLSPPAAELHHGHGGENTALADGAAAVPGGRP